jgi:nitrate reductase cytochrome c-type subunit
MSKSVFYKCFIIVAVIFIFYSCAQNDKKNSNNNVSSEESEINMQEYLLKGKSIAIATKELLGKQLINAINAKGTDKALEFCNIKAIPLTDSMSVHLGAKIKRVSDKYRNPDNAANEMELEYIKQAQSEITQHGNAKPRIFEDHGKVIGYYPIVTNALCLQCHGNLETDINEATRTAINIKYPQDKATAYSINELRGIWVIEMEK